MRIFIVLAILLFPLNGFAHTNEEFLDTVEQVRKSIVLVESKRKAVDVIPGSPLDNYLNRNKDKPAPTSIGTGFIILHKDKKYIITNNHVIENGAGLQVSFEHLPGKLDVEVVGTDPLSDIAVLKADILDEIQPLSWGEYNEIRPGMDVWAIGHPKGLMYTVSKGVVSHTKRRVSNGWQTVIQSDVAINQGNSGGPLMDMEGNVIAINTLILSKTGESIGLSMSVDSRVAQWVIERLIEEGAVRRPKMGVQLTYDSSLMRVRFGDIETGSAADKSGLLPDDVLIEADGNDITHIDELFDALQYKQPNDHFPLLVMRKDNIIELDMVLGEMNSKDLVGQKDELNAE